MAVATWVVVALAAAGTQAGYETLQKHLTADVGPLRLSHATALLGTVLLAPVAAGVLATQSVSVTPAVTAGLLVAVVANVLALYAYLSAMARADLSVVSPLRQSTPLLVAVLEPLALAGGIGPGVVAGAAAAAVGGYVVLADRGLTSPLGRLTEAGPLLALGTAALYAVASVAARFVVVRVPSLLFTFMLYLGMAVAFGALLWRREGTLPGRSLLAGRFLALGATTTLRSVLVFAAFSLAAAARVTVVLRVSLLVTVLAGGALFGERGVGRRLLGAGLVVAGVWLAV
ncbi:MAG: EamA family transporter [Halorientalis sp.]